MSVIDSENNSSGMEIEFKVWQQIGFGRILRSSFEIISRLSNLGHLSYHMFCMNKCRIYIQIYNNLSLRD